MLDQDINKEITKDLGSFMAEQSGYCFVEGSELDIGILTQQYSAYVKFKTYACDSVEQTKDLLHALTNQ